MNATNHAILQSLVSTAPSCPTPGGEGFTPGSGACSPEVMVALLCQGAFFTWRPSCLHVQ